MLRILADSKISRHMTILSPSRRKISPGQAGFTLVEMLLVVAVISILASMVISSFSDSAQTSREIVQRQQQAVLQAALDNWVNSKLGRIDGSIDSAHAAAPVSINGLAAYYNAKTPAQRFGLISSYLDSKTTDQFTASANGSYRTSIMEKTGYHVELPDWNSATYPQVDVLQD
jgi:prepilin-type N-terminal cleavage/methylation domain-containing protein